MLNMIKTVVPILFLGCYTDTFAQDDSTRWSIHFSDLSTHMRLFGPEKTIHVSQDSVWVYKPRFGHNKDGRFKRTDMPAYAAAHHENLASLLAAMDSLQPGYFNLCINGGLIFHASFTYAGRTQNTWISNRYLPQVFAVLEKVNALLPDPYHIGFDKIRLDKMQTECDSLSNP